jgi:hypothetical protein
VKLHLTCRDSVQLIVASEDRALTTSEKVALRMHLWMCRKCPKFLRQMQIIRRMLDRWKADGDKA